MGRSFPWNTAARSDRTAHSMANVIQAIRAWIESHPRKAELYAFLLDKKET